LFPSLVIAQFFALRSEMPLPDGIVVSSGSGDGETVDRPAIRHNDVWFRTVENPYDGHTLAKAIAGVQRTTGVSVDAFVGKGYLGHDYKGEATIHLAGMWPHVPACASCMSSPRPTVASPFTKTA
jgi:hypothetical protein